MLQICRLTPLPQQHVKEVKLNDGSLYNANIEFSAAADGVVVEDPEDNDDRDWVSLSGAGENLGLPHDGNQPQTMSEQIAQVSISGPVLSIPDRSPRNSSCRISQKRQKQYHHLRSIDFDLPYSDYIWLWSPDTNSLSTISSRLQSGRIKIEASVSALCVPSPA